LNGLNLAKPFKRSPTTGIAKAFFMKPLSFSSGTTESTKVPMITTAQKFQYWCPIHKILLIRGLSFSKIEKQLRHDIDYKN